MVTAIFSYFPHRSCKTTRILMLGFGKIYLLLSAPLVLWSNNCKFFKALVRFSALDQTQRVPQPSGGYEFHPHLQVLPRTGSIVAVTATDKTRPRSFLSSRGVIAPSSRVLQEWGVCSTIPSWRKEVRNVVQAPSYKNWFLFSCLFSYLFDCH